MNWKAAISSLKEDIDGFVKKRGNKVSMPLEYFTEWKFKQLEIIHKERKVLKGKVKCRPVQKVLQNPECCRNLEELKDKYVLVPIDKGANNIGFICRNYFLQVLQEETMSPSYIPCQDSVQEVMNAVASKCQVLGVQVPAENKNLPQIDATIKMHKEPEKFCYIIGSRHYVTKQVARKLVQILKLISRIHRK